MLVSAASTQLESVLPRYICTVVFAFATSTRSRHDEAPTDRASVHLLHDAQRWRTQGACLSLPRALGWRVLASPWPGTLVFVFVMEPPYVQRLQHAEISVLVDPCIKFLWSCRCFTPHGWLGSMHSRSQCVGEMLPVSQWCYKVVLNIKMRRGAEVCHDKHEAYGSDLPCTICMCDFEAVGRIIKWDGCSRPLGSMRTACCRG